MRFSILRSVAAVAFALVLPAGCSDLANAVNGPTTTSTTGQITFWTSDSSPSYIDVALDGGSIGILSAYRVSAPTCGASSTAGTLTVTVAPGGHTMYARETSASGTWGPSTINVKAGGCVTFELTR
jgi:hypothetical protein